MVSSENEIVGRCTICDQMIKSSDNRKVYVDLKFKNGIVMLCSERCEQGYKNIMGGKHAANR